jgi:hypothetical protein
MLHIGHEILQLPFQSFESLVNIPYKFSWFLSYFDHLIHMLIL